jgi:hypothetical protein
MKYSLLFLVALLSYVTKAQDCSSDLHRSFDFWIGDWEVVDTAGKKLGENSIKLIEAGCILEEHWTGSAGGTGSSWNYVDADSTWNQLWIDALGGVLKMSGGMENGSMILRSEWDEASGQYNQITWTPRNDGTVIQHWEALNREGKFVKTVFYGIYRRKI